MYSHSHLFKNKGSVVIEMVTVGLVCFLLFTGFTLFIKSHRRDNPEVIAQRQCNQQMFGATTLFAGLFEKQIALGDFTPRVDELAYLNDVVYNHANTPARNFTRMWFTESVVSPAPPLKINPAQFKLDVTNLAQALYNGDRRFCTEQYGMSALNGRSIKSWLGDAAPAGADEVFLKIEPIDRAQHTKLANCQHPIWTAPAGISSFHDAQQDGFTVDGNPNIGFELTWTSMKHDPTGQVQTQCQIAEKVEHLPELTAPPSPVLMGMTNGNGTNLLDPVRARTTCDSEEGNFDQIRMTWDFDHPVQPGQIFLCRTWTVYGDQKNSVQLAASNLARTRGPATSALNPTTTNLQMKSSAHAWDLCTRASFEVGDIKVPIELVFSGGQGEQKQAKETTARMKVNNLPKQDVEYFVEMKVVDMSGSSSPASATAQFNVDVNRPGILEVSDASHENAIVQAVVAGPTPSNFRECEIVSSDIPDAKTCYDGEKCLIRAPQIAAGEHNIELRARDVCGKLSSTVKYNFTQKESRMFASISDKKAMVSLAARANNCTRPALRNLSIRCQSQGAWGAWSTEQYPLPAKPDDVGACELRFDVMGAVAVEHRGIFDRKAHRDVVFTPSQPESWSTFTEPFPVGYVNPKSFFRSEHPLVLYPVGDCFDGQPFTVEMLTSCQQGTCAFTPGLALNTCASNSSTPN